MRALVISDIHSNLQALEAVLAVAPHYDTVWNLGDVVGYGGDPNEVVELARSLGGIVVRGNHDKACSGIMGGYPILDLNFIARRAADWTRETLTRNNTERLSNLPQGPLRPLGRKVDCVHGSPRNEDEYVLSEATASFALSATRARIIFCGHTHEQFGFASIQCELAILKPSFQSTDDADSFVVPLSETERYLLNPGSVGQPRDHDWRASFAIYNDAQSLLTWYRVPYDLTTAQVRIRKAGLPFVLATRLGIGA